MLKIDLEFTINNVEVVEFFDEFKKSHKVENNVLVFTYRQIEGFCPYDVVEVVCDDKDLLIKLIEFYHNNDKDLVDEYIEYIEVV